MYFNAIPENKILTNISEFTVSEKALARLNMSLSLRKRVLGFFDEVTLEQPVQIELDF